MAAVREPERDAPTEDKAGAGADLGMRDVGVHMTLAEGVGQGPVAREEAEGPAVAGEDAGIPGTCITLA